MHHGTSESDESENYPSFSDTEDINKRLQGQYIPDNCVHLANLPKSRTGVQHST